MFKYHYSYLYMPGCGHVLEGYVDRYSNTIVRCLDDNCPHSEVWESISKVNALDGKSYMSMVRIKEDYKGWYWRHRKEGFNSEY